METVAEYQYFTVVDNGPTPGRKTSQYYIISRKSKATIGTVKWYSPWRQFCFFPHEKTIWNSVCLMDIRSFLKLTDKMQAEKVRRRYTGD